MRLIQAVATALALIFEPLLAGVSAQAASQIEQHECSNGAGTSQIMACTRLVDDKSSSDADRAVAYGHRGLAWLGRGNKRRALADITVGLGIAPRQSWCHTALAIYHYLNRDYVLAIIEYNESIRLTPSGNALAYFGRGVARLDRGDTFGGNADVVKARAAMPDVSDQFKFRYGIVLYHTVPIPVSSSIFETSQWPKAQS